MAPPRVKIVTTGYTPRPAFVPFHTRTQRWGVLVCHRRAGKTVAAINDMHERALHTPKSHAQYAYIAPYYSQAKRVAWEYLLRATEHTRVDRNIADLIVTLHNGSKCMLFGADNPDAMRGIYLDGAVVDEPADMRPRVFTEVLRPLLADRQGWAVFIGTPKGKNEFWRLRETARQNPATWFLMTLKASESGLLLQSELDDARRIMSEDEYEQEFECSFDAAIRGAIYGRILNDIAGRIHVVPHDPSLPVHAACDIGWTDSTAWWLWQNIGTEEIHILNAFQRNGLEVADYVDELRSFPYTYGDIWVPHDARARSLASGGRSVIDLFHKHGVKPRIAPEESVQQGIYAGRYLLSDDGTHLDHAGCTEAIEALRQYQYEWDDIKQTYKNQPKHDHTSHYADGFRYMALVAHRGSREAINRLTKPGKIGEPSRRSFHIGDPGYDPRKPFGGNVTLNGLGWNAGRRPPSGRIN